jgi:Tfp pilus assembly protein FimT
MKLNICGRRTKNSRPGNPQPTSIRTLSGARGVTLVELVIVVAMIMIVTAISVPMVQSALRTYRLNAAVATFTGSIRTARYQAIMKGYYHKISFNSGTETYQIASRVPPAVTFSNVGSAALWATTGDVTMNPTTAIYFSPGGIVSTTAPPFGAVADITLHVTNGVLTKTITVSSVGNVNVQ